MAKKRKTGRELSGGGQRDVELELSNRIFKAKQKVIAAKTPNEKRMAMTSLSNLRGMMRRLKQGKKKQREAKQK